MEIIQEFIFKIDKRFFDTFWQQQQHLLINKVTTKITVRIIPKINTFQDALV